jgi:hypothetical protein
MITHQNPTLGRPQWARGTHLGTAVAGIGLAALLAVGLLAWRAGHRGESATPASPVSVPAATDGGRTAPAARSLAVYLVGTEEEAGRVAAQFEALDPERRHGDVATVVVDSEDQARRMRAFVADLNRLRDAEGLAPVHVVDGSTRPATPERVGSSGGSAPDGGSPPTGAPYDMPHITP